MTGIPPGPELSRIDASVAHSARFWNYLVGGKDNFAADREAAEQVLEVMPLVGVNARADRAFLGRAVRYLTAEAGIGQFLDIGTGIPTASNTHEVAQAIAPEARVVYVDNDPVVLVHARALLTSTPQGATDYVDADLRDPGTILDAAAATLDLGKPVAIMLLGILNFISDAEAPDQIVARLLDAVPAGSYLAISHPARDIEAVAMAEGARRWNRLSPAQLTLRTHAGVSRFFDGLDLLEPGVVPMNQWRPDPLDEHSGTVSQYGGVGRK